MWPVSDSGGCGVIHPASQARSTIATSTCLMVTGSALMPSTQAASHGAGHNRPVNSGKLLVACSLSMASAPVAVVDEVVPFRDQVAQRTCLVAEGNTAIHAAPRLLFQTPGIEVLVDLLPILNANLDRAPFGKLGRGGRWSGNLVGQPLPPPITASTGSSPLAIASSRKRNTRLKSCGMTLVNR